MHHSSFLFHLAMLIDIYTHRGGTAVAADLPLQASMDLPLELILSPWFCYLIT